MGQKESSVKKTKKKKEPRMLFDRKWNRDNPNEVIERVVFNNKVLKKNKNRAMKSFKRVPKLK